MKVSVIIPCHNSLPYIRETFKSITDQSYKDIEIIIVDDHSNEETKGYLDSLKSINNLTVLESKEKGACYARNLGFNHSTGDLIQFLDSDDLLSPNKIEEQVRLLEGNANFVAVCSTAHFIDSPDNHYISDKPFMFSTNKPQEFLLSLWGSNGHSTNMVQTNAWLCPRNLIEKSGLWDPSLIKDQDGEFFCRVVMQSEGIIYAENCLNYYRKFVSSKKNISSGITKAHFLSQFAAIQSKQNQLQEFSETIDFKTAFAIQYKHFHVDSWPAFKDLSLMALKHCDDLGGTDFVPKLGGKVIVLIQNVFGWKFAKQFRIIVNKLRGK